MSEYKTTGEMILELRKKHNMTQEELAEKVFVTRTAISKWERNVNFPNIDIIKKISAIFDVPIEELLFCVKKESDIHQYVVNLNNKNILKYRIIKLLAIIIIAILLIFTIYYFLNNYKKVIVYRISGEGNNAEVVNGIFFNTKNKTYFSIILDNPKVKSMSLYYKDKNEQNIFICSVDSHYMFFSSQNGYNEFLNQNDIKYIINNLYIEVETNEQKEIIYLFLNQDYINDNFFDIRNDSITVSKINRVVEKNENLKKRIVNIFTKNGDGYIHSYSNNDLLYEMTYVEESDIVDYIIYKKSKPVEEWIYSFNNESIVYKNYINKCEIEYYNDKCKCNKKECDDCNEIVSRFQDAFYSTIYNSDK